MSSVELHKKAHELFNARDWDGLKGVLTDSLNYEDHPRGLSMKSGDEFMAWAKEWTTAFSNARVGNPRYIDGGDWSICCFQAQGVNDGPMGDVPASGGTMDMPFCEIFHWTNGKADRAEIYYDQVTMMTQLGVMEAQPA